MATKYQYDRNADKWLDGRGFTREEKDELLRLLNRYEKEMRNAEGSLIVLPKGVSGRVAAFFDLLHCSTDAEGMPTCFEKTGIRIPEDVEQTYTEGMEIHELEELAGKLRQAKMGRERSDPRRRSSGYG